MIKIPDKPIVFSDVDDTLVMWKPPTEYEEECVAFDNNGVIEYCLPHKKHIELLRQFKARGHTVVVWSQGGSDWAEQVIKKLGIEDIVDIVMPKPFWYIDDIPAMLFMEEARRIFRDPYTTDSVKRIKPVNDYRSSNTYGED